MTKRILFLLGFWFGGYSFLAFSQDNATTPVKQKIVKKNPEYGTDLYGLNPSGPISFNQSYRDSVFDSGDSFVQDATTSLLTDSYSAAAYDSSDRLDGITFPFDTTLFIDLSPIQMHNQSMLETELDDSGLESFQSPVSSKKRSFNNDAYASPVSSKKICNASSASSAVTCHASNSFSSSPMSTKNLFASPSTSASSAVHSYQSPYVSPVRGANNSGINSSASTIVSNSPVNSVASNSLMSSVNSLIAMTNNNSVSSVNTSVGNSSAVTVLPCLSPAVAGAVNSSMQSNQTPLVIAVSLTPQTNNVSKKFEKKLAANQQTSAALEKLLSDPNNVDVKKLKNLYRSLENLTPNKTTKSKAGQAVVNAGYINHIIGAPHGAATPQDIVAYNQAMLQLSPDSRLFLKQLHGDILASDYKRKITGIHVDHAAIPVLKYNAHSQRLEEVQGGHNLLKYVYNDVPSNYTADCFVDAQGVIGFYVQDCVAKTVLPNFTEEQIINNWRHGNTFARGIGSSSITLTRTPQGIIVASYADKRNPTVQLTQFPVYTIDFDTQDQSGNIVVGYLSKINPDMSSVTLQNAIVVSSVDLQDMMDHGTPLQASSPDMQVVDITRLINTAFAGQLSVMGHDAMPGSVYAYRRIAQPSASSNPGFALP